MLNYITNIPPFRVLEIFSPRKFVGIAFNNIFIVSFNLYDQFKTFYQSIF